MNLNQIRKNSINKLLDYHKKNIGTSHNYDLENMADLEQFWKDCRIYNVNFKYEPYDQIGWFVDIEDRLDKRLNSEIHLDRMTAALLSTANYLEGNQPLKKEDNT